MEFRLAARGIKLAISMTLLAALSRVAELPSADAARSPPDLCVARTREAPVPGANGRSRVGIILVFCDEPMAFLQRWKCSDGLTLYVFSKCGADSHPALGHLGQCTASFQVVHPEIANDLSGVKHHTQYLQWIVDRYDSLHEMNWFLKGTFPKCMNYADPSTIDVAATLAEVRSASYAFKSFGHIKITAVKGPAHFYWKWEREICTMLGRYICQDACGGKKSKVQAWWNRGTTYAISGSRIRTLPRSEYAWLAEYGNSLVPGSRGIKRRFVLERIWQAMLGCPSDVLKGKLGHCPAGSAFPSGEAVDPPRLLTSGGVVSWPLVRTGSGGSSPKWYMQDQGARPTTFVVSVAGRHLWRPLTSLDGEDILPRQLRRVLRLAARIHRNYRFVFLSDPTTPEAVFAPSYWSGLAQLIRYNISLAVPGCAGSLQPDQALGVIRSQLEARFLQDLLAQEASGRHGNLVLMDPFTIFAGDVSQVFSTLAASSSPAGIPATPTGEVSSMVTWYVREEGVKAAAQIVQGVVRGVQTSIKEMCRGRGPGSVNARSIFAYEAALGAVVGCCSGRPWGSVSGGCAAIQCPPDGPSAGDVTLLPCTKFAAAMQSLGSRGHKEAPTCQYWYGRALVGHLAPDDRPMTSTAAKRMFCIYTDYCDGRFRGSRYDLRHGEKSNPKAGRGLLGTIT